MGVQIVTCNFINSEIYFFSMEIKMLICVFVVFYHVIFVASGLRFTHCREFIILHYADPLTSLELLKYYLTLVMNVQSGI